MWYVYFWYLPFVLLHMIECLLSRDSRKAALLLAVELKVKSRFWTIIVNATIKECQIVSCIFFFFIIIEIQKAKDDAEEAYNSISEVAKKEVNKMIYKSLLMILDI